MKDDLQTLIDLPLGHPVDYYDREAMTHFEVGCTTDTLIARALELQERREYCEHLKQIESSLFALGYRTFEAWQNAKREGKL